jgi:hypothetical protein
MQAGDLPEFNQVIISFYLISILKYQIFVQMNYNVDELIPT